MKVKFDSKGGFDNVLKWMNKVSNPKSDFAKNIAEYADLRLQSGTPEDTGDTAAGWKHQILVKKDSIEIAWENDAHPESDVNVAKLIEFGHGTRTGGYVQPRPFIKQAMAPVWKRLDNVVEELMK